MELPRLKVERKTGDEPFRSKNTDLDFTVLKFWQWAASDLVSNATRGLVAEFIVASALGLATGVRDEWQAYDLETKSRKKIEVKSAAYLQSPHKRCSRPTDSRQHESGSIREDTMRTILTRATIGAGIGIAVAILMISIVQLRPFSVPVNSFIERQIIWLCPLYILGFSTDVTSKSEWFLITIAGNALLYGAAFVLVTQAIVLLRKAASRVVS